MPLKVVVTGYGRLGAELARGLVLSPEIDLAGIVRRSAESTGTLDVAGQRVPVSAHITALLDRAQPDVLLEASLPTAAVENVNAALERGIAPVIATSGLPDAAI